MRFFEWRKISVGKMPQGIDATPNFSLRYSNHNSAPPAWYSQMINSSGFKPPAMFPNSTVVLSMPQS